MTVTSHAVTSQFLVNCIVVSLKSSLRYKKDVRQICESVKLGKSSAEKSLFVLLLSDKGSIDASDFRALW